MVLQRLHPEINSQEWLPMVSRHSLPYSSLQLQKAIQIRQGRDYWRWTLHSPEDANIYSSRAPLASTNLDNGYLGLALGNLLPGLPATVFNNHPMVTYSFRRLSKISKVKFTRYRLYTLEDGMSNYSAASHQYSVFYPFSGSVSILPPVQPTYHTPLQQYPQHMDCVNRPPI